MIRGSKIPECNDLAVMALLMDKYHQPYSEIKNMSLREIMFLREFANAENEYMKMKSKQMKGELKKNAP